MKFIYLSLALSTSLSAQTIIEDIRLDSNYLGNINPNSSISSSVYGVSEYWIENRLHQPYSALYSDGTYGDWNSQTLQIGNLVNPADSTHSISINYWQGVYHPESQSSSVHEKILFQIANYNNSTNSGILDSGWFYCGTQLNYFKDTLHFYNIDVPTYSSSELLSIMPLDNSLYNGIDTNRIWMNITIRLKSGIDSSKVFVNGQEKISFTPKLNSFSQYSLNNFMRISTTHGLFDDIILFNGDLSQYQLDSINSLRIEDSVADIKVTPQIYGINTDTIKFSVNILNDSIHFDSLVLAHRRYYWQIDNGNGWTTNNTNSPNHFFYNGIAEGVKVRCIVSGFGTDTSITHIASYDCGDTIIEHSPQIISIPINSSVQIETSDKLGLASTKQWQISNFSNQGVYWTDLTNNNCQNCSGFNSDTLTLNTPAVYRNRKFRKIISGCVNDTSNIFTLELSLNCGSSPYNLPYYYTEDSLLAAYWKLDLDSIIKDETGNHCGIITDSMSSFINDRYSSSNSALQANGEVYFSNSFDSLQLSNEFTLNFWHRTDSIGGSYVEYMRLYSPSTLGNNGVIEIGRHWNIGLAVKQGFSPFISAPYGATLVPNTWTMLTVVYKNDSISLFMNGTEIAKTNHTLNFYDDFYLKIPNDDTYETGRRIDEMTMWYRAVEPRDLRNMYQGCIINEVYQEPIGALAYTNPGIASFSLKAYEDPSTTYQWEMNSGGASWITLTDNFQFTGTDKDSLFISNITAPMNNYSFRCLLSGCLSDTSSIVSLTVIDGIGLDESLIIEGSFYPNPTSGLINLDVELEAEYYVYNINGQIVAKGKTEGQIDITNLPTGSYQLIITNEDGRSVHTIQKI